MNKRNVEKEMKKNFSSLVGRFFGLLFTDEYTIWSIVYMGVLWIESNASWAHTQKPMASEKNIQRKRKREKKKLFEQTTTTKLSKSHAHISRSSLVRSMKTYEDTIPFDSFKRRKKEREKDPKRVYEASRLQQWTNMRWAKSVTTPTFFLALPTKDIGNFQRYSEPNDS